MFQLLPALEKKDFVLDLPLCRVLFEDNCNYPWIFLVPKRENIRKISDLKENDQVQLIKEIALGEKVMSELFHPDQINAAAIGNKTPQLHIHIIARKSDDISWPGTVWGEARKLYDSDAKAKIIAEIAKTFQKY